jgi:hypothetical protein
MAMVIEPYRDEHVAGVREFNRRLKAGGETEFAFPESAVPDWLPKQDGRRIFQEFFVALDEDGVHGGYIVKHQDFSIRGANVPVGYYHLPLSEGIVNKTFSLLGSQLLLDALRRQPIAYALGMGSFDRPLPRMLKGIGWKMHEVPFYFRVTRPFHFLRNIRPLRRTVWRRIALDVLAFTGVGSLALHLLQQRPRQSLSFDIVPEFSSWADDLWDRARSQYDMVGSRDSLTLNILYPASSERFTRIRVGSRGWAVVLDRQMRDHKYFGDMRVGTIADCFAAPTDASAVIAAATSVLRSRGVDLIVSNQSHDAWCEGLRRLGFRRGPSNFIFAASKKLAALLQPFETSVGGIHLTRGDGDGPIHL